MDKEKVYISRDEGEDFDHYIYVWRKPLKGNWSPIKKPNCEIVLWEREDIDNLDIYLISDFKKKFGITIRSKNKKCIHLPIKLLNNEDYKLFSNDPKRKK